ncbi:hypothetical protein Pmar_PMAR010831, partial [Perkinsus marinus ATCC 50983]
VPPTSSDASEQVSSTIFIGRSVSRRLLLLNIKWPIIYIKGFSPTARFIYSGPRQAIPVLLLLTIVLGSFSLYLHYNFVAAVLNDLFGIQARGGCACAGPYAETILGLSAENATKFEEAV